MEEPPTYIDYILARVREDYLKKEAEVVWEHYQRGLIGYDELLDRLLFLRDKCDNPGE